METNNIIKIFENYNCSNFYLFIKTMLISWWVFSFETFYYIGWRDFYLGGIQKYLPIFRITILKRNFFVASKIVNVLK